MTSRKKTPPQRVWMRVYCAVVPEWVRLRMPLIGLGAFVVLGFLAFIIGGNLISDVKDQTQKNAEQADQIAANQVVIRQTARDAAAAASASNRLSCILSRAVTSVPLARRPGESAEDFHQRVRFSHLIVQLAEGIDCHAALAPVLHPKGGGSQSPQTGSQLPGGQRAPLHTDMAADRSRLRIPAQARILAAVEGHRESHRSNRRSCMCRRSASAPLVCLISTFPDGSPSRRGVSCSRRGLL